MTIQESHSARNISAIWLRTIGGRTQVLVEQAGQWKVVIDELGAPAEQEISHIAEASAIDSTAGGEGMSGHPWYGPCDGFGGQDE